MRWQRGPFECGDFGENGRTIATKNLIRWQRDPFESGYFSENGEFVENSENGEQSPKS